MKHDYRPYRNPLSEKALESARNRRWAVYTAIMAVVALGAGLGADEPVIALASPILFVIAWVFAMNALDHD